MLSKLFAILTAGILTVGCGIGNFIARVDDASDRICLRNEFPQSVVTWIYDEWKIPARPQFVSVGCNLVFELQLGGLGWAENGDAIIGLYEPGGIFRGSPTVNVAPLDKWVEADGKVKGLYSKEVASHEFGHAMFDQIGFLVYSSRTDSHSRNRNSRMHYQYLPRQVVTEEDRYLMNAARLRHPAPRVLTIKVLPTNQ